MSAPRHNNHTHHKPSTLVCASLHAKLIAARRGQDCEALVDDPNPRVHEEAARSMMRGASAALARRLANSPYPRVRAQVARQGLELERLCEDPSALVRAWAATRADGAMLEGLLRDGDALVADAAHQREMQLAADSSFGYDTPWTSLDDYKSQAEAFSRDVVGRDVPNARGRAR